jgi:KilA-N domain
MDFVHRSYEGVILVFDTKSGYINATALARRYYERSGIRRNPGAWLIQKRTRETLSFVAKMHNLNESDLVEIRQGGVPDAQGTFLHPDLGIPFSNWLSVEFEYCTTQIILRRMVDSDSTTKALKELVGVLVSYFKESESHGASIHTSSHQQMEKIRAGMKIAEDCLENIKQEDKTLPSDVLLPEPDPEQI